MDKAIRHRKSKTLLFSNSKKFIFIHNYKFAGTSVRNILSEYQSEFYRHISNVMWLSLPMLRDKYPFTLSKHTDYQSIKLAMSPSSDSFLKFGFVRNHGIGRCRNTNTCDKTKNISSIILSKTSMISTLICNGVAQNIEVNHHSSTTRKEALMRFTY